MDSSEIPQVIFGLMVITGSPAKPTKADFDIFHQLAPEQYSEYLKALGHIQNSANGGLLVYVQQSQINLESAIDQMRELVPKLKMPVQSASANSWFINIACLVLTFCSALHLYQEQTLEEVRRTFGRSSPELKRVAEIFSHAYDTSFEYRLLYRLRNVLVHHSLGSVGFEISSKEDRSPSGLIIHKHTVRAPLKREIFLAAKKGASATLRHEVESLDGDPDLVGICADAMTALGRIHDEISLLVRPSLREDALLIRDLDTLFDGHPGARALAKFDEWPPRYPMQVPISYIPSEIFEHAQTLIDTE
jgi:hypothetical protein